MGCNSAEYAEDRVRFCKRLGSLFSTIRQRSKLSVRQIVSMSDDITIASVNNLEKGTSAVNVYQAMTIFRLLGVTSSEFRDIVDYAYSDLPLENFKFEEVTASDDIAYKGMLIQDRNIVIVLNDKTRITIDPMFKHISVEDKVTDRPWTISKKK